MVFFFAYQMLALQSKSLGRDYQEGVPDYAKFFGVSLGRATEQDYEWTLGPPDYYEASTIWYWHKSFRKMNLKRPSVYITTDADSDNRVRRLERDSRNRGKAQEEYLVYDFRFVDWKGKLGDCNPFCSFSKCTLGKLAEGMSVAGVRKVFAPLPLNLWTDHERVSMGDGRPATFLRAEEQRWIKINGQRTLCMYSLLLNVTRGHLGFIEVSATVEPHRRSRTYVF
jgi:hypothetical protein